MDHGVDFTGVVDTVSAVLHPTVSKIVLRRNPWSLQ